MNVNPEDIGVKEEDFKAASKPIPMIKFTKFWNKQMCKKCKDAAWVCVVRERKPFSLELLCESCKKKAEAFK